MGPMKKREIAAKYDKAALEGKGEVMENSYWPTVKKVVSKIPLDSSKRVLDLGAGNGYASRYFDNSGSDVLAIDISKGMIRSAKDESSDHEIKFIIADMHNIPFVNNCIDLVFSMGVLPYAKPLDSLLSELYRILSDRGHFYSCVNYYSEAVEFQKPAGRHGIGMELRGANKYKSSFINAGFSNVIQKNIPNKSVEIPPKDSFPTKGWETRNDMEKTLREFGTLLTIGEI